MSEVSDFCHGIDTQSGMMTKSMVEKKCHKTLVVLVGAGKGVEEGVESIWVILCPCEGWCFEGSLIWVMEKKSENLGLEI